MIRALLMALVLMLPLAAGADISFEALARITDTPERHRGSFVQEKYLQAVDASLQSNGVFDFERGKSIRWEIQEPIRSEILMTPDGISSRSDGEPLLKLDAGANPAVAALGKIFFAVLTSDWQTLEAWVELSGSIDGDSWYAVLEPKTSSTGLVFSRLELSGGRLLEEIVLHESSGDRTTIRLDSAPR